MLPTTLSCKVKISDQRPSKRSAQTWPAVEPSMSWALMRMSSPTRLNDPSSKKRTPSSEAIAVGGVSFPLYAKAALRDTTKGRECAPARS